MTSKICIVTPSRIIQFNNYSSIIPEYCSLLNNLYYKNASFLLLFILTNVDMFVLEIKGSFKINNYFLWSTFCWQRIVADLCLWVQGLTYFLLWSLVTCAATECFLRHHHKRDLEVNTSTNYYVLSKEEVLSLSPQPQIYLLQGMDENLRSIHLSHEWEGCAYSFHMLKSLFILKLR